MTDHSSSTPESAPANPNRPPFETFKHATCRGSYALGTACGNCEACIWEREHRTGNALLAPIPPATGAGGSVVRMNAEADPNYRPYCLRCVGLVRMRKIEPLYWRCDCGAEHDERTSSSTPASEGTPDRPRARDYNCPECDHDEVLADRTDRVGICAHCGWHGPLQPLDDETPSPDGLCGRLATIGNIEMRCENHGGHDGPCWYNVLLASPLAPDVPVSEIPEQCHACQSENIGLVIEGVSRTWGDWPPVTIEDRRSRCQDCGEEWYDFNQSMRHTSAVMKATLKAARAEIDQLRAAARQSPDAGGAETPQERVNRILTESRQAVQPTIDAEAQGENVGDVMDFVMRSPDTGAGVGTKTPHVLALEERVDMYVDVNARLQARNAELEAEIEGKVYAAEIALTERVFEKVLKSDDGDVDSADPADWIIAAVEADWRRTNEQAETAAASQAERIGELEADDKRTRAFIISCPWCGMQMESRPARFQITHLIDCGDKQTATAWQLQVDKADLDWLDTQRSDVTDDDNQPDGDVRLLGHAWGIYGACETIREAIRGARSTSTGK